MELKVLCTVLGLIKGSRWRKASKCKSLIKQLRKRLMIQKNRRNVITRQLRADIAQLLQNGQHKFALSRAAQLYKDQCTLSAYDQLENFFDCIYTDCHNISRHSHLSSDMREAVSSLIFAASRCGELPELHLLRKLFTRQFGQEFERENVELLPGNTVNSRIKQSLTTKSVTLNMKIQLIDEIANERIQYLEPSGKEQDLVPEVDTHKVSKHYQEFPLEHVCSNLSEDGMTESKIQASKYGNKLQRTGSKFRLDSSGAFISENCNTTAVQKKSHRDSSWRVASNNLWVHHQTAIGCADDVKEHSGSREDYCSEHDQGSVPSWVEKLSSMIYMKKRTMNERCNAFIKNDMKNATSNRSLAPNHSHDQLNIEGKEETHRSQTSHIHPKLPDYDDLVAKFKDLKEEYMEQSSDNKALHKWMRW